MATLGKTAAYIRSKNAGPFWITMDLFCDRDEAYEQLKSSANLNAKTIAGLYGIQEDSIKLFYLDALKVIKISFPRKKIQGSPDDSDMHGGQQYIPLLSLEL